MTSEHAMMPLSLIMMALLAGCATGHHISKSQRELNRQHELSFYWGRGSFLMTNRPEACPSPEDCSHRANDNSLKLVARRNAVLVAFGFLRGEHPDKSLRIVEFVML